VICESKFAVKKDAKQARVGVKFDGLIVDDYDWLKFGLIPGEGEEAGFALDAV